MKKRIIYTILWVLLVFFGAEAQIVVEVNGFPQFDTSSFTITEAGNDFTNASIQSGTTTSLNIFNPQGNLNNYTYSLNVNLLYPAGTMSVTVARASDGTNKPGGGGAGGLIWDGLTPVRLATTPIYFFGGKGDRYGVNLRFGLEGLSVINPAGDVPYTVVFTVTEI